jgi:hypothetical protein
VEPVPVAFQHYLLHGDWDAALAADPETSWFDLFMVCRPMNGRHEIKDVWAEVRSDVLTAWVQDRPGTRPWAWWEFDAPPWTEDVPSRVRPLVCDYADVWQLKQPRRRLGGIGTPAHEALNYHPEFDLGVPKWFVSAWDVAYYNGRARDIHGHRIGTDYRDGQFPYQAIDPADPPRYESQASYLERHGFLATSERSRLPADAFDPVTIAHEPSADEQPADQGP